jgi:hypothetical protein
MKRWVLATRISDGYNVPSFLLQLITKNSRLLRESSQEIMATTPYGHIYEIQVHTEQNVGLCDGNIGRAGWSMEAT